MATTTTYTDEARRVIGGFVLRAGRTFVVIRCSDVFEQEQTLRVTLDDLARFYRWQAGNYSGIRTLGSLSGDWRPVSELARACLDYFKTVNVVGMRRAARKIGLIPRF